LLGQQRIAAGDQALVGVVGVADLGEVVLIEQGGLQWATGSRQLGDRRGAPNILTTFPGQHDPNP
jgi:hypothetical protein